KLPRTVLASLHSAAVVGEGQCAFPVSDHVAHHGAPRESLYCLPGSGADATGGFSDGDLWSELQWGSDAGEYLWETQQEHTPICVLAWHARSHRSLQRLGREPKSPPSEAGS